MNRADLIRRLWEIDNRIAAIEQWGALLSVLSEERRAILRRLNAIDAERPSEEIFRRMRDEEWR